MINAATARWRLPQALSRLVVIPIGANSVVLAGGLTAAGTSTNAVSRLNLATGASHRSAQLSKPVHDAAGALIGGEPVVFGGGASSVGSAVQSPSTGALGMLPGGRADLSATSVKGTAYLIGGYDGATELPGVLATSDGRAFRRVANLVVTVRYTAVATARDRIWVFGGSHYGRAVRTIQEINPSNGAVHVAGHLPVALSDAAALDVHGHLLIVGGRTSTGAVSRKVFEFDPSTRSARQVAHLAAPVADPGYAVVGGRGYLFGGEQGTPAGSPVSTIQVLTAVSRPAA